MIANYILTSNKNTHCGIFAQLRCVLPHFHNIKSKNLIPYIEVFNSNYLEGKDIFDVLFKRIIELPDSMTVIKKENIGCLSGGSYDKKSRDRCNAFISEFFQLKDNLYEEVENFCVKFGINEKTLGVHFRGLDKWKELKNKELTDIDGFISEVIKKSENYENIFLCTDDLDFYNKIIQLSNKQIVLFSRKHIVFSGKQRFGTHHAVIEGLSKREKLIDAIMDSYILSKTGFIYRNGSNLSFWSLLLNPSIDFFTYNF